MLQPWPEKMPQNPKGAPTTHELSLKQVPETSQAPQFGQSDHQPNSHHMGPTFLPSGHHAGNTHGPPAQTGSWTPVGVLYVCISSVFCKTNTGILLMTHFISHRKILGFFLQSKDMDIRLFWNNCCCLFLWVRPVLNRGLVRILPSLKVCWDRLQTPAALECNNNRKVGGRMDGMMEGWMDGYQLTIYLTAMM